MPAHDPMYGPAVRRKNHRGGVRSCINVSGLSLELLLQAIMDISARAISTRVNGTMGIPRTFPSRPALSIDWLRRADYLPTRRPARAYAFGRGTHGERDRGKLNSGWLGRQLEADRDIFL